MSQTTTIVPKPLVTGLIRLTPGLLYPEVHYAVPFPTPRDNSSKSPIAGSSHFFLASIAEDCFADALTHTPACITTAN